MIKICDAVMGSGKTSAAINYMNSHQEKRFIYITPYLEEAKRIKDSCPDLKFVEPNGSLPQYNFRKYKHTLELARAGRNIASTHQMFLRYSQELADVIRERNYTLIIDEDVEVLEKCDTLYRSDLDIMLAAGWAHMDGEQIRFTPPDNYDGIFKPLFDTAKERELVDISGDPEDSVKSALFYWIFTKSILEAFEDVYVMTYMFDAQTMRRYFDLCDIQYGYTHIAFDGVRYTFSDEGTYVPDYIKYIGERLHVIDHEKLNDIGKDKFSLSATWYAKLTEGCEKAERLRKNLENFFKNVSPIKSCPQRMWSSFESGKKFLRGKGYFRSDTAFNMKATNEYRDKHVLAYLVNVFMNPFEKRYLTEHGVDVKEDDYALSVMVQWIWRSAIRDGGEIWVYIPSKRMRELLLSWMDSLEKGGAPDEIV